MPSSDEPFVDTLASFADTLVSDFDVSELIYRLVAACVDLAGADEAGLLLMDKDGMLGIAASTSESTHLVELLQLQAQEGPCLDAFHSGEPVHSGSLTSVESERKWPAFASLATAAGFHSVLAVPMRLRDTVLGSLNLFRLGPEEMTKREVTAAQVLADLSTIAIIQDRVVDGARELIDQLQTALDSRVSIEQAKGILAERAKLDLNDAFEKIRTYARSNNLRLSEVSARISSGDLDAGLLIGEEPTPSKTRRPPAGS